MQFFSDNEPFIASESLIPVFTATRRFLAAWNVWELMVATQILERSPASRERATTLDSSEIIDLAQFFSRFSDKLYDLSPEFLMQYINEYHSLINEMPKLRHLTDLLASLPDSSEYNQLVCVLPDVNDRKEMTVLLSISEGGFFVLLTARVRF